jgi:putative redox protein
LFQGEIDMSVKIVWQDKMAFKAQIDEHTFMIDTAVEFGGQNKGPSPKKLTLISLAGCTGMDVVSILSKMKVAITGFEIETIPVIAADHPKKIESITLKYILTGDNIPAEKVIKAIKLSEDKYCGVMATLKPTVSIAIELYINGEKIAY